MAGENTQPSGMNYPAIISVIGSPLRFFSLTALICSAVFSLSAGIIGQMEAFIYSIHMFLAIVGLFVLIAIWCPSALYHPQELENIPQGKLPLHRPWAVTVAGLVGLLLYMAYQYVTKYGPGAG